MLSIRYNSNEILTMQQDTYLSEPSISRGYELKLQRAMFEALK
jgi:hypothetical protein